jgi:hypothetical protein
VKNTLEPENWSHYKRAVVILAVAALALGIMLIITGLCLRDKTIALSVAKSLSSDGYVTPTGLARLSVAVQRLVFLGGFLLACGFALLSTVAISRRFKTRFHVSSTRNALSHFISYVRWDRVLGAVGIGWLCLVLIVGVFHAPFSVDGPLRFDGAKQYINMGNTLPYDAGGNPIEARKEEPLPRYIPAMLCALSGGGLVCSKALYAIFCLICVLALGYAASKAFGSESMGYTVFIASVLPVVHWVATDSARTEFIATIFLVIGVLQLYQGEYKSRWTPLVACLAIGISTWLKHTLVLLLPAFVITGLISGTDRKWSSRTLSITIGPFISVGLIWVFNSLVKAILLGGGKATFSNSLSYWLTSSVHDTLSSTGGVSYFHKLFAINHVVPLPVVLSIILVMGVLLCQENFANPLRLFVFVATIWWITWWLVFSHLGILRHLLVGLLLFSVLMGGFCASVFRHLTGRVASRSVRKINIPWPHSSVSLAIVVALVLAALFAIGITEDFAWIKWSTPMRRYQEQLAQYVAASKESVIFCSWGQISAYDISSLANVPFWDISKGLPPDNVRRDRTIRIIVTAWQKKNFELESMSEFKDGLFPGERTLIDSKGKIVASIGDNDIYEIIEK